MEDDTGENQADRWQKRQRALAAQRIAIPVYTPGDYPLIRQLPGTDDMPLTWEEWRKQLELEQKQRARAGDYRHSNVRVRPDLFRAWLDANSQVALDRSRQRYAQELLDTRAARRAAYDEEHRQEIEAAGEYPAAPVYAPRDYPFILELSATGDLPATRKEWWENFKASEAERRQQGLFTTRARVHAGKFKAWLQANSLSSSEQTRQKYAQQRLDMKRARRAARRAEERLPWARRLQLLAEASQAPSPWPHKAIEVLAYALLAVAIAAVLFAVKDAWHRWTLRELPGWQLQVAVCSPRVDVSRPMIGNAPAVFLANYRSANELGGCTVLAARARDFPRAITSIVGRRASKKGCRRFRRGNEKSREAERSCAIFAHVLS